MLDWSVAPPDGLSIPPPHTLGPGRLTGKAYTSMGSLLWLPVSRVQSMEGTNTRLDGAQAIAVSLLGNTALSKFQYLLCPLLVITSLQGCYHWPRVAAASALTAHCTCCFPLTCPQLSTPVQDKPSSVSRRDSDTKAFFQPPDVES